MWIDTDRWGVDRHEDVALGYLLSQSWRRGPQAYNVTWADPSYRIKNLGCFKNSGGYLHPRQQAVAINFVKAPAGQLYLWDVLHGGLPHDSHNCTVWAGIE